MIFNYKLQERNIQLCPLAEPVEAWKKSNRASTGSARGYTFERLVYSVEDKSPKVK
ncbi:MAG: hypothetical protein OXC48_06140 [Endozoicomonadaceae bacterium]|nr:hypothetical protein [Endozoicomonadaceae bacterium]